MTKKYILFMIDYEPEGGMNDIFDSFDTIKDCMDTITIYSRCRSYQIVDASTWQIVKKGEC